MVALLPCIFSTIGTILSVLVTLSPFPSFLRAWNSKQIAEISHLFLLASNLNTLIWIVYSLKQGDIAILIPNVINSFTTFTFLFLYHLMSKDVLKFLGGYLLCAVALMVLAYNLLSLRVIGIVCVVSNFLGYAAPIEQLGVTLLEKQSRYIDINVIAACLFNSVFWVGYGVVSNNYYVVLPNTGGFFVSLFQVLVYLWAAGWLPQATCSLLQGWQKGLYTTMLNEGKPLNKK